MRAVIYTRVSTDEQAKDGFSLSAQLDKCLKYIEIQGWKFIEEYKDNGYSAKNLKRPAMQRLIRDIRNQTFDMIVIYRLDRLVRHVGDLNHLLDLFKEYNVSFVSVTEHFDTSTATGRLFMNNVASMAQWERENLSERVRMGMEQKASQGQRNGGPAPYGYRQDANGKLVIEPSEAMIVKRIFELYIKYGVKRIQEVLHQEGKKPPGSSKEKWSHSGLLYIIENPVYTGKIRFGHQHWTHKGKKSETPLIVSESDHEPIITNDMFEKVQHIKNKRSEMFKTRRAKSATSDYYFSTVLVCGRCGGRMYGDKDTKPTRGILERRYRCTNRASYNSCNMPRLRESKIEEEFLKKIDNLFNNDDIHSFRAPIKEKIIDHDKITNQINRLKESRKKWQVAFGEGLIELEELRGLIEESKSKESELYKLIEQYSDDNETRLSVDEFKEIVKDMKTVWNHLSREDRKQIVMELVEYLVVDAVLDEKSSSPNKAYKSIIKDIRFL